MPQSTEVGLKRFDQLAECPQTTAADATTYRLDTTFHPDDPELITLSAVLREETMDNDGKTQTNLTPLFRHLLLNSDDLEQIKNAIRTNRAEQYA